MIYVLDTRPLVWYLEGNKKLSPQAAAAMSSASARLVVPTIVLAEIRYLYERKRIRISLELVRARILSSLNCSVHPLDEAVLELFPSGLDIHDAVIVGTALVYRDVLKQPTQLISRDQAIADSRLIDVLW